jgi:uncharacterized membrane protein
MTPPSSLFAGFVLEGVSPSWWWLWVVLAAAGVGFLAWTYHGIFQRSEHRLTWALLLLRAAGLVLLVLALAKPTWTRESVQVDPGRVAVILDNSRSMSLADSSGETRYARAVAAVSKLKKDLEGGGGPVLAVDLFDINGALLNDGPPPTPAVGRTDLGKAIREATRQLRSRAVAGVVVVSDGMDNTGRPSFRDWEDTSVPIHGLGFRAGETGDLDLAVRKPQVPARVLVHNEMRIEVPVSKSGRPATEATVFLKRGREVLASQKVTFAAGAAEQVVPLTFTPRQPGSFVFTASVESSSGERYLGNNAVYFPLRVDDKRIRVLYVEGFLRYEYKYLKARLEDDPDIDLDTVVRRVSPDVPEGRAGKEVLTEETLKNTDVVILGDMEAGFFSQAEYRRLLAWLDDKDFGGPRPKEGVADQAVRREHSLLALGGYRSLGPDGFRKTPLADVLPVVLADGPPYQLEESFPLKLTPEGQRHPLFTLTKDTIKDAEIWNGAPPLQGMAVVQGVKPDAEELAVNPKAERGGKPAPVLVVRRAGGGGHVMVLTADTTWRWSRVPRLVGQPDTLYSRFWSQAVRWLAGRGMDDDGPLLAVNTDRPDYDVGRKVTVTVRRQPKSGKSLSAAEPSVEVLDPAGKTLALPLKGYSADPDRFTAEFYPSVGGRYELSAALKTAGKPLANQTAEFLVQGPDLEMANTGTNPNNLRTLAEVTGGVYLDIDNADQLPNKIARKERRTARVDRSEYWNAPWLFLGFLGLVTGEWFLRRRNHLL